MEFCRKVLVRVVFWSDCCISLVYFFVVWYSVLVLLQFQCRCFYPFQCTCELVSVCINQLENTVYKRLTNMNVTVAH